VSQNVIGTFPGRGALADEWIAVSAHYDHLGCVDEPAGVVVYNGADDNASGTSLLLEMARALVASDGDMTADRRSVMFIAFGAEEPGLIGSQFFVASPPVPIENIVGVVNLDMVGRLRDARLTIAGTTVAQGWETVLEAQNTDDLRLNYDDAFLLRGDHYSFIQAGTPSVHIFTESHSDYHQPTDGTDGIDFGGLVTVGEFSLRVVTALRLSRVPIAN
jgi:Zn-dependent M28 family amino/carboxypeptidase